MRAYKQKYCYAIVYKEDGRMLLSDGKLPLYWNKKVANSERAKFNSSKLTTVRLKMDDIENLILKS